MQHISECMGLLTLTQVVSLSCTVTCVLAFVHILPLGWARALHQQTSIHENKSQGFYSSIGCHRAPSSMDTTYLDANGKCIIGWPSPRGTSAAPCHWKVTKFPQRYKCVLAEKLRGPSCKGNLVIPQHEAYEKISLGLPTKPMGPPSASYLWNSFRIRPFMYWEQHQIDAKSCSSQRKSILQPFPTSN